MVVRTTRWLLVGSFLALLTAIDAKPVLAKPANFESMTLSPGFSPAAGTVTGYTGGSYSLSALANRDRNRNLCVGYGDPTPDHVLILEKDFPKLTIQVNSNGANTTLVAQGPSANPSIATPETVLCGDDTGQSKDASVQGSSWRAGKYHIWVGTIDPGTRSNYTLTVSE